MMKLALLGNPVEHSKSPGLYDEFLERNGIQGSYELVKSSKETFKQDVRALIEQGYTGFNITHPFKTMASQLATEHSEAVKHVGAANTLYVKNNDLVAENTDWLGFWNSLDTDWQPGNVLILGNGGAARAVKYALELRGKSRITTFSREQIASLTLTTFQTEPYDLIVNCTPLGSGNLINESPIPSGLFLDIAKPNALFYDLIYEPMETVFLSDAKKWDFKIQNGSSMLRCQAYYSFMILKRFTKYD